jgi:hypothetical protein
MLSTFSVFTVRGAPSSMVMPWSVKNFCRSIFPVASEILTAPESVKGVPPFVRVTLFGCGSKCSTLAKPMEEPPNHSAKRAGMKNRFIK